MSFDGKLVFNTIIALVIWDKVVKNALAPKSPAAKK